MNLGFDAKRLFLNQTGLGNYSRWLLSGLIKKYPEHHYHLYTTGLSGYQKAFEAENTTIHLPPNLFKGFWRSKGIKKDLLADGIDVYHGLSNELPLGIEKTKIRTVVTIHDLIFRIYPEYYNGIDRKIYDIKFRSACERADRIVAISEHTRRSVIDLYGIPPEKTEVIYLDSPEIFLHPADEEETEFILKKYALFKPYFLNVGSIGGRKNQFRLLEAFADVADKIEHDLVLAGKPGKETGNLLMLINKYSLTDRVKYFPNIPDRDLFFLYHGSYATVFPSLYEGFGIPILESLRSGKPVVTSKGSSLEEVAGKAGLFCDPLDVTDISSKILKITGRECYQALLNSIPSELNRFNPEKSFARYMQLYEKLRSHKGI